MKWLFQWWECWLNLIFPFVYVYEITHATPFPFILILFSTQTHRIYRKKKKTWNKMKIFWFFFYYLLFDRKNGKMKRLTFLFFYFSFFSNVQISFQKKKIFWCVKIVISLFEMKIFSSKMYYTWKVLFLIFYVLHPQMIYAKWINGKFKKQLIADPSFFLNFLFVWF